MSTNYSKILKLIKFRTLAILIGRSPSYFSTMDTDDPDTKKKLTGMEVGMSKVVEISKTINRNPKPKKL